jgi:hypothetical protein
MTPMLELLTRWTEERLVAKRGTEIEYQRVRHPRVRLDGKPIEIGMLRQLIKAAGWVEWIAEAEEGEADIRLLDFAQTFAISHEPSSLSQPFGMEAPETIFADYFDYRVDLWRAEWTVQAQPMS